MMNFSKNKVLFFVFFFFCKLTFSQVENVFNADAFNSLEFRSLGPAYTGGRIADFAVNPHNSAEYFVAVAAGNVWKTTNNGTTWTPVFDNYGAWSIADVEIDPNDHNIVWVATGEYNSQREIGYGDGVYLSIDGGNSFKNMGLTKTEHIGRLVIDPRNSHVYVAAQGPLWGAGGERGLYKTTDMGKTWTKILDISDKTGITDIVYDPRNPDILYCASYQRERKVYTLIDGGPESAIYKSVDAGKTWEKLTNGLPSCDMGRIGLAISPLNPDNVYAIIEAAFEESGFYRSTNRGATWQKMSDYVSTSPQYYNRIFCDLKNPDKVFSVDTYSCYTLDGGKTWTNLGLENRHVDDHALWIDPQNPNHFLIGGDGGVYETYDHGNVWDFKDNLPITQFYRVAVDNSEPFYFVYGGTQDNNSLGGPSQTFSNNGISNADWFVTNGGDGFFSAIDTQNPNIVYAEAQYGWAVRYDKQSGEAVSIKPAPPIGEAYRWNWNSPLEVSHHEAQRIYFAANKLFRSNDRGDSWEVISPDLTRQIDRNTLPVMGIIQSVDAVAKNASTSFFGAIVAFSESPMNENLLYVGTDDGLIQMTTDGGKNWTKFENFSTVPTMTYVSCVTASAHTENLVYATFDGRKNNDLKPYILKSTNNGRSWSVITKGLPERGTVYSIVEDHINKNLLFAGTEFGIYFSINQGEEWIKLNGGLPTTCVRDIAIQKNENDLVIATFGRGFYVLDNYAPLREVSKEIFEKDYHFFDVADALVYIPESGKDMIGHNFYSADNPEVAAVFTFYQKEALKTRNEIRIEKEKADREAGRTITYPTWNELRMEDNEPEPFVVLTVKDEAGNIIRRLKAETTEGISRVTWDLCYASSDAVTSGDGFTDVSEGHIVAPGKYSVSISYFYDGKFFETSENKSFEVLPLKNKTLPPADYNAVVAFQKEVAEFHSLAQETFSTFNVMKKEISAMKTALWACGNATNEHFTMAFEIENKLNLISIKLYGDETISSRNENQTPSFSERIDEVIWAGYSWSGEQTQTIKNEIVLLQKLQEELNSEIMLIYNNEFLKLKNTLQQIGAPFIQKN